jgi:hypothetical protein
VLLVAAHHPVSSAFLFATFANHVPPCIYLLQVVGAKSKNLAGLRGKLPDWISLPSSCTVGA